MNSQASRGTAQKRNMSFLTFLTMGHFLEYYKEIAEQQTFSRRFTDSPADKHKVLMHVS